MYQIILKMKQASQVYERIHKVHIFYKLLHRMETLAVFSEPKVIPFE